MQAHVTNYEKTQENNAKMLLIMLKDPKNINKKYINILYIIIKYIIEIYLR